MNHIVPLLRCPICQSFIKKRDRYSLICANNHTFNISKWGYINLLTKSYSGHYEDSEMYIARQRLYAKGIFSPIQQAINNFVIKKESNHPFVLDVGCGEGSMLRSISSSNSNIHFIGMDISKSAITKAAKSNNNIHWILGDLCNIPLKSHSVNFLIDMFTPSNYSEFKRVLKRSGYVIKIIPQAFHFQEVRKLLNIPISPKNRSETIFKEEFNLIKTLSLNYLFSCETEQDCRDTISMSPLKFSRTYPEEKLLEIQKVTIDAKILFGKKEINRNAKR